MFRFENEYLVWLFVIIPFIFLLFIIKNSTINKRLKTLVSSHLLENLIIDKSNFKKYFKISLITLSLLVLILGIMNPQIGTKMKEVKREGIEIIFAIDISNSMLAEDISPNRLERAKQAINNFIDKLVADKIGIVIFAGEAFLQLPLTTDYSAAKLMNSTITTDLIPTQGTAIGSAIELSKDSFSEDDVNKVIIVITDGENHEDDAIGKAKEAIDKKIIINTIGMGSIEGGPIPILKNGTKVGFQKNNSGETIVTKLNEGMLRELSSIGGGIFVRGTNDLDIKDLLKELQGIEKSEFDTKVFTDYEDKFQIFFGIAFILLILELVISNKRNRFFSKISKSIIGK